MNYTFTSKNFKITDALSAKIAEKMSFLKRYFIVEDNTECHVNISEENGWHKIELMVFSKAGTLRSEQRERDLNIALDNALDKLEQQINRNKDRLNRRHKSALATAFIQTDTKTSEKDVVVRTKTIHPLPLELEEAILEMEMLGHTFFIYTDQESENTAVVYKRHDGGYGLIEIEE